jgi:hypothetical protein
VMYLPDFMYQRPIAVITLLMNTEYTKWWRSQAKKQWTVRRLRPYTVRRRLLGSRIARSGPPEGYQAPDLTHVHAHMVPMSSISTSSPSMSRQIRTPQL